MRYYIIAGEASGDLHGSNLMKGIYAEDPQADIRFWGGDLMVGFGNPALVAFAKTVLPPGPQGEGPTKWEGLCWQMLAIPDWCDIIRRGR